MSAPATAGGWRAFWDGDHSIYVNDRHRTLHYQTIAADFAALLPKPDSDVLDHGCGEALAADRLAAHCRRLVLFDAAPSVQAKLRTRFATVPAITVVDEATLEAMPDASFDAVILNSVAQYLDGETLDRLLRFWRRILRPDGMLILADIIPPDVGALTDAAALLRFAHRGGFLGAALIGLARTALSDYRKLRGTLGLSTFTEAAMRERLTAAGFTASRAAKNVGHNGARMTFLARPRA